MTCGTFHAGPKGNIIQDRAESPLSTVVRAGIAALFGALAQRRRDQHFGP